jgi:hypothetical protein
MKLYVAYGRQSTSQEVCGAREGWAWGVAESTYFASAAVVAVLDGSMDHSAQW